MSVSKVSEAVEQGGFLTPADFDAAFAEIMDGKAAHEELMRFLAVSTAVMGNADVIASGARALRERMVRVNAPDIAIDVCGTGGDGAKTLNISTAVAFVVAGAGVPVAKHGNRAMSSQSGAADVLEALGVKITADVPTLERCLCEANIAFLHAQHHHPAVRHVAAARKEFGKRTIFNLLGPLSNPAGVKRQLLGVFGVEYVQPVAEALRELGSERAWVVHGHGGLDELSGEGENEVIQLQGGALKRIRHADAAGAGMSGVKNENLAGGTPVQNAAALRKLLQGDDMGSDYSEVVQLNAAAALVAAGVTNDLMAAGEMAMTSLMDRSALAALEKLVALTKDAP